jgi:hypothetical protein
VSEHEASLECVTDWLLRELMTGGEQMAEMTPPAARFN